MKKVSFIFCSILAALLCCKEKNSIESYYSKSETDSIAADIITYIYVKPQAATWQDRFDPQFRNYYVKQLKNFEVKKYFIADLGIHYFFLIRPAVSAEGNFRGVGGSFKLTKKGEIVSFKELFNTPAKSKSEVLIKGEELFNWMTRTGNVTAYLQNADFIEWPNKFTYYDTIQYQWLIKPGL